MSNDDEGALLDALKAIIARYFPIVGELCRLELADPSLVETDPRCRCDGPLLVTPWSVSLCVKTSAVDKIDTEGALAVCDHERRFDPRVTACLEGQLMALTTVARAATRKLVRERWAVGYLNTALPLSVLPRDATRDDFCRYFLTYPWLGRLLPERPAKAPPYVRAPPEECLRGDALDLDRMRSWIGRQVPRSFEDFAWDDAMIAALPEPVRVLEAVDMLHAMVGGNGFEVWLSQARGADLRRAHEALGVLGATKLRALMASGLALAAHQGAEFCRQPGSTWTRAIKARRPRDWREIDGHEPDRSYALLESELTPLAHKYAEAHRDTLLAVPSRAVLRRRGGARPGPAEVKPPAGKPRGRSPSE